MVTICAAALSPNTGYDLRENRADWVNLMIAAARLPLRSDPAKSQHLRANAHGQIWFSHQLFLGPQGGARNHLAYSHYLALFEATKASKASLLDNPSPIKIGMVS